MRRLDQIYAHDPPLEVGQVRPNFDGTKLFSLNGTCQEAVSSKYGWWYVTDVTSGVWFLVPKEDIDLYKVLTEMEVVAWLSNQPQ